jgi:NAD(P)H dehydrogenase (quinone)
MKIGVTGATGQLGQLVVHELKAKLPINEIVALVRNPQKAQDIGVETREFDYAKPENLSEALKGIGILLLISGNEIGKRFEQHANVISSAQKAGVKQIVYTSLLHADKSSLSLAGEHLATENLLKESGIPYTILRNGWYTENYTSSIGGALAGGAFIGSAGDGKISSAARKDFASAAVKVLTTPGHTYKTYELAGDEAYTLTELAAELSHQSGKNIPYKNLPESEYANILKSFSLPGFFAEAIANWDVSASQGDLYDNGRQLSELIGQPTTSLAQVIEETLVSLK